MNNMYIKDQKIFRVLPARYLLLNAGPGYIIENVTDEYLAISLQEKDIIGKPLFTVFPDNPKDPFATWVKNLTDSLEKVVHTKKPHAMPLQRYDTRIPGTENFAIRYWKPLNIPVIGNDGIVQYILHSVEDSTQQVLLNKRIRINDHHTQQQVAQAVLSTQEMERMEISRELHDNINQILITSKMYLGRSLDKDPFDGEMAKKGLLLVEKAIMEIKKISTALTQVSEEEENLVNSLENLLGSLLNYGTININKKIQLPDESLINAKVKQAILRIVQEQLANILKHAEAKNLFIGINFNDHVLSLTIRDDGKGFTPSEIKAGLGFQNMKTRVALMDGKLEIESAPGDGCTIMVNIPVPANEI